jgi:1-acyl-sn-glycerol-3-phosphate acyltransferase
MQSTATTQCVKAREELAVSEPVAVSRSESDAPDSLAPPTILQRLLSTSFWVFLAASSIVLFIVACLIWLVTLPFDRQKRVLHQFTCFWGSVYTWLNPAWRVTIEGREHIQRNVAYVMVANHQSLLDILVLFRIFKHFKWVSKIENFRVPCVGWNMSLNRYIKLRRGDATSTAQMMTACEETIGGGSSVMMFPEGTRSKDGRLKAFKHGAFTLAKRCAVPILPIIVEGTGKALPKKGFVLRGRHRIRIRILPALMPSSWPIGDATALAEHVHRIFQRALGELDEAPVAAAG